MTEHPVIEQITREYQERFPLSRQRHERLLDYVPGGTTRSLSYFKPWPMHISHGQGAYVYTHEGHALLDVTNAYGALIHGHGDPDVVAAVKAGIEKGSQYSTPTDGQFQLARLLCKRVPGLDKIRFLNSGTEATMFALRTARAFTGRDKILKMTGGFHGTHDCVAASTKKNVITAGIPAGMTRDMLEAALKSRFNEKVFNIAMETINKGTQGRVRQAQHQGDRRLRRSDRGSSRLGTRHR